MAQPPKDDAVEILREVRTELTALTWRKVDDDGHTLLIAKADALQIIQDWIEDTLERRAGKAA